MQVAHLHSKCMLKVEVKMVEFISTWARQIVVAVIVATIIEMLVPNGNSKKYIKTVIGIFILFNIITPIIDKFTNGSVDVNSIINLDEYNKQMESKENTFSSLETSNNSSIKEIYLYNLKRDIKTKLEEKECIVNDIEINIQNSDEYRIKEIILDLEKSKVSNINSNDNTTNEVGVNKVEEVNIQIGKSKETEKSKVRELNNREKSEIKEYLSSTYDISTRKITIK